MNFTIIWLGFASRAGATVLELGSVLLPVVTARIGTVNTA
jgi:hypothetical protein